MIVSKSYIGMSASHQQSQQVSERESLQRFQADGQGNVRATSMVSLENTRSSLRMDASDAVARFARLAVSPPAVSSQPPVPPQLPVSQVSGAEDEPTDLETIEPRLRLLAALVSVLSNREVKVFNANDLQVDSEAVDINQITASVAGFSITGETGLRYEWSRETSVSESTSFSAEGRIITTDGKTIDIGLDLQMEYRFTERESLVITAGVQLKDPLVINFNGRAAELTAEKLSFDIDADGKQDSINRLASSSGLLMLDRNGDGKATDGRELFGAISGNGFADLALYDEDSNGFIDQGDSAFGELKIWIRAVDGTDQYFGLAEKGVGALYLGSVSTPFTLYTAGNELSGQIKSTGIYVGENGSVGTLQQIDLVV